MSLSSRRRASVAGVATVFLLRVLVPLRCLVLLLAPLSIVQAQAQELRAAPPADPGVLKRAPETVLGVEVSTFESGKGWIGFGTDAAKTLVERGEVLVDTTLNDYRGSGGFRRQTKNMWNNHFGTVRGLTERVGNTVPYKIAPQLLLASDLLASVVDPLLVGDGRGAVSGAVDLGVTSAVSSAGSSGGEWLGILIGGAVGSWVPVVGNAVGATVGGAVGSFAGGYLAAAGYEGFLKGSVIKGIEAGIATLVDPDPLLQKMQANEAALYRQLSPELAEMIRTSQSFGGGELQLQDWGRLVTAPAPDGATQPQQPPLDQAALTTGNVLAGVRKFSIGKMEWEINGGVATHRQVYPGPATSVVTARGTVFPNRIEGTMVWTFPGDTNCDVRESEHFVYVFDAENVSARNQPGPVELRGPCKGTWDKMTRGSSFTAPWRKIE